MARRRGALRGDSARLRDLFRVLRNGRQLLVLLQDSPDPDAIASAAALRRLVRVKLGLDAVVAYGGIVGRAENRAMLRAVGFEMQHIRQVDFGAYDRVALVDTQPGVGNNSLPPGTPVDVVLDHHPLAKGTRAVPFADVRPRIGATTTILYGYLKAAQVRVPDDLAVAMLYGIRSDTMELGRQAAAADTAAYLELYPRVNKQVLAGIAHADLPPVYFQLLAAALTQAEVTGPAVVSALGDMNNPDMIAEVADLLLRLEGARCVLCYGFFERQLLVSVRTEAGKVPLEAVTGRRKRLAAGPSRRSERAEAGPSAEAVARQVVAGLGTGGGHQVMAGGQIPVAEDTVAERERLANEVVKRFREVLGLADRASRPLLELASTTAVATTSAGQ